MYDLLPARFAGLFHVGRLDMDSEGLLLLTNEGGVANRLMHPSGGVDRVYRVDVEGVLTDEDGARLLAGVELEDGRARAHELERLSGPVDRVGHPVRRLIRTRLGPVTLGALPPGEWRELTAAEVEALRAV